MSSILEGAKARARRVRWCVAAACAIGATAVFAPPTSAQISMLYLYAESNAIATREALLQDPCFTMASPEVRAAVNPLLPLSSAPASTLEQDTLLGPIRDNEKTLIRNYTRLADRLLDDYKKLSTIERAYGLMGQRDPKKAETAAAAKADKEFLRAQLKFMPAAGGTFAHGEPNGWCRVYACRVQNWVSRPAFRQHVARYLEIEKRIEARQTEARDFLARGAQGVEASQGDYRVFRSGKHLLVGQLENLKTVRACDLAGWGPKCEPIGRLSDVTLTPVSPAFSTQSEARDWYCTQMKRQTVRTVMLTGGRDREAQFQFSGNEYLYIQNGPACPAGEQQQPVANTGDLPWDSKIELASGPAPNSTLHVCQ